jgi:hypothetical protein
MAPDCEWLVAFPCSFPCPPDLRVPYIQLLANSRLPYFTFAVPCVHPFTIPQPASLTNKHRTVENPIRLRFECSSAQETPFLSVAIQFSSDTYCAMAFFLRRSKILRNYPTQVWRNDG